MSVFVVQGKPRLKGSFRVSGNKNEALPAVAASLLCPERVTLTNVPNIGDIRSMLAIAGELGAEVGPIEGEATTIRARRIASSSLPLDLGSSIRGSILFASALLVRTGRAVITQPGGDAIGRRRVDTHFLVLQALGARLTMKRRVSRQQPHIVFSLSAPRGLTGAKIYLDEASVTATENALIAAAGARGTTHIVNAASEPHVQGLCRMLVAMGAEIEGIGSNVLTVHGTSSFKAVTHELGSDYIEAGSLIGLAAATRSAITVTNIDPETMRMILFQFERIGVLTRTHPRRRAIVVPPNQKPIIHKDLGGAIPKIEDSPWPGFPADLTSIILVTATQCQGTCLVHEKMFESRLFFVDKLIGMGAEIVLCDPHRAVVVGPSPLYGSTLASPDIRAGMALLIAALAAEGQSTIQNIEQIDRGYENIDGRLRALGAHIERIDRPAVS